MIKKNVEKSGSARIAMDAVFVAVVIAGQLALSLIPGVEIVTVLFVSYSFVVGAKHGIFTATAFSLLRQIIFGFFPTVLLLYLIYFNLLTFSFGMLGRKIKNPIKCLPLLVIIACIGTILFSVIDNILTPLWYGYSAQALKAYFIASLSFMIPQVICTAVSVTCLFLPLWKIFKRFYRV